MSTRFGGRLADPFAIFMPASAAGRVAQKAVTGI